MRGRFGHWKEVSLTLGCFWDSLGHFWGWAGCSWALLGSLRVLLGRSGVLLGRSWVLLECSWDLGVGLGCFGGGFVLLWGCSGMLWVGFSSALCPCSGFALGLFWFLSFAFLCHCLLVVAFVCALFFTSCLHAFQCLLLLFLFAFRSPARSCLSALGSLFGCFCRFFRFLGSQKHGPVDKSVKTPPKRHMRSVHYIQHFVRVRSNPIMYSGVWWHPYQTPLYMNGFDLTLTKCCI